MQILKVQPFGLFSMALLDLYASRH